MRLLTFLFLLEILTTTSALKFFLYNPKISKSTIGFMNKIGEILTEGGHEVVQYMPEFDSHFGSAYNSKTARVIERKCELDLPDMIDQMQADAWHEKHDPFSIYQMTSKIGELHYAACKQQLNDHVLMERLAAEKFDLGITDYFETCSFGIFERIGVKKHIMAYSNYLIGMHGGIYGIPQTPSFVPELQVHGNPLGEITFWDRFMNLISFLATEPTYDGPLMQKIAQAFGEVGLKTNLHESMSRSSYFFINTDEHVDFPRPISHKVIHIGGLRMKKSMEKKGKLDTKLQKIFQNSRKGVVFVSFGSIASSYYMPNETKQAFLDAFDAFPEIDFLWKYEKPDDPLVQGRPNLHVDAWLPQKELFAQENLLAFVSHAGMNSITEATYSGVPVISIPLFGDQPRNGLMIESRGMGLVLNKNALTKNTLVKAIRQITENKKFKQNAREISQMIHSKPMGPDERVLKYTEHAVKFDVAKNLDLPGRHLSTIAFYNLDVWALLISIFALTLFVLLKFVLFVAKMLIVQGEKRKLE